MKRALRKHHRTYHLPWSEGASRDDLIVPSDDHFTGLPVVVTEKMDGENTSLYRHTVHARSVNSGHHPSRAWIKGFWAKIAHAIPDGLIIRGENLYATHSIYYADLPSYFMGFAVETAEGLVWSWRRTVELFEALGIEPVPVIYEGLYNRDVIHRAAMEYFAKTGGLDRHEGYVVRVSGGYLASKHKTRINKWVRKDHVTTDGHWMHGKLVVNGLAKERG